MKKLLLAVAGLLLAVNAHATNLTWGIPHRVPTQSVTVTVANCTTNGTTTMTTTADFQSVQPGMLVITGGTLGTATTATVISRSSKSLVMSLAAGTGTGTATFTFPPKVPPISGEVMMGVNLSDSSGTPLTVDGTTGGMRITDVDRDRDFPLITQLFAGQNLLQGQTFSMTVGVPLIQYTRAAIMLTWAAAIADTDSVRIAVRVYGLTSSTSSNWHLWTPMSGYATQAAMLEDTCVTPASSLSADTAGAYGRCPKPVSFWVIRKDINDKWTRPIINASLSSLYQGNAGTSGTSMILRKMPAWAIRWASANGVMLNLSDNSGNPISFPYVRIEVYNASTKGVTLSNVEANLWPRVQ